MHKRCTKDAQKKWDQKIVQMMHKRCTKEMGSKDCANDAQKMHKRCLPCDCANDAQYRMLRIKYRSISAIESFI
jgi:hypothetical protein